MDSHRLSATASALVNALREGVVVLDGGLSTELERAGHDISGDLWSAVLLRAHPAAVRTAHVAFFAAGAQVATTASYQATFPGFAAAGVGERETRALLRRSVALAREAAEDPGSRPAAESGPDSLPSPRWVAASVGPYGAMLAGGEEYTGAYADPDWSGRTGGGLSVIELREFHRPRLEVLADSGADVLAEVARLGVPAWLSLTTVPDASGVPRTRRGEPAADAFAMAADVPEVIAVGVNCVDPAGAGAAVASAASRSGRPVVVYPNSGETWDGARRAWRGVAGFDSAAVRAWRDAGARLIGGCCRIGPAEIAEIAATIR
jgi:homocysteine S-methyltransferase